MATRYPDVLGRERNRPTTPQEAAIAVRNGTAPDLAARSNMFARQHSVPAETAVREIEQFETNERSRAVFVLTSNHPNIAGWFANNNNAAVAADDLPGLNEIVGLVSSAFSGPDFIGISRQAQTQEERDRYDYQNYLERFTPSANEMRFREEAENAEIDRQRSRGTLGQIWGELSGGLARAGGNIWGLGALPAELIGGEGNVVSEWLRNRNRIGEEMYNARRGRSHNPDVEALYSGVGSTPTNLLAIGATALTRNPEVGAYFMGSTVAGGAYVRARDLGLNIPDSIVYSVAQGGTEILFERVPLGVLSRHINDGSTLGRMTRDFLAVEVPQEQLTTITQDFVDYASLHPERSLSQYLAERPQAARETFLATLSGAGPQIAVAEGARRIARRSLRDTASEEANDRAGRTVEAAAESATRSRDPEAFRELLEAATGEGVESNIYVPGEVLEAYNQENPDDDTFNQYAEQIGEAVAAGGDVVIPLADAATNLAGTPAWEAIQGDVRALAGGASRNELEAAAEPSVEVSRETSPEETMTAQLRDALMNAGETPTNASLYASIFVQREATRAARAGRELTGNELSDLGIRAILPEGLQQVVRDDGLGPVIAAMRGRVQETQPQSLVDFIREGGGIMDRGGDLADMLDGQNTEGLLLDDSQGSLLPGRTNNDRSVDNVARRAVEAGYLIDPDTDALRDMIVAELNGEPVFPLSDGAPTVTDEVREQADQLEALLDREGLDANASDADIRAAVERYQQEASNQAGYEQANGESPRGRIVFEEARATIELFESRNLSTVLHEAGHLWLHQMERDAALPDATDQLKADYETVLQWFRDNGHDASDGIPEGAHEMWARGVERYLMEGKAPTRALAKAFAAFRSWLVGIYKTVKNLNAPITPEIREVMDRLLATDQEIAEARQEQALEFAFDSAEMAGATKAEYEAYRNLAQEAKEESHGTLLRKTMAAIRAKETKEYKRIEKRVRAEIAEDVSNRPMHRAVDLMRSADGPKLDRQWVEDVYGADTLLALPAGAPPLYKENGDDADVIAEMTGFSSGDELVKTLIGMESNRKERKANGDNRSLKKATIETETDAVMKDRYGDPLNDGSIEEKARAAVHGEKQGEVLAMELRLLGRQTNKKPTPRAVARSWAERKVREGQVNAMVSRSAIQQYTRAAAKAGKEFEAAILAGDKAEAFTAKQKQMLQNELANAARKAADEVDTIVRRLGKLARQKESSMHIDYFQRIHDLLANYDFRQRSQTQLDQKESFEEWAKAQTEEGYEVHVPPRFADPKNWSRLTVEELYGLNDTVKSLQNLGQRYGKIEADGKAREFEELLSGVLDSIEMAPGRILGEKEASVVRNEKPRAISGSLAPLIKVESIVDDIDNFDPNGLLTKFLTWRASDAETTRAELRDEVLLPIARAFNALSPEHRKRLSEKVTIPEFVHRGDRNDPRNGRPTTMTRMDLLTVMLNTGNESNFDKLVRGEGWSRDAVLAVRDRELTKADWDFMQEVGDMLGSLWPRIVETEKAMGGLAPEKIELKPIESPYGTYDGWYWPVKYDPNKSTIGKNQEAADIDDLYGKRAGASTDKGHTITRTGFAAPLLYSFEGVLHGHLDRVITRISHGEFVRDAMKLIRNNDFRMAMSRKYGEDYYNQFEAWIRAQVGDRGKSTPETRWAYALAKSARINFTIVALGLRASTGLAQELGLMAGAAKIGAEAVARGNARLVAERSTAAEFVFERSPEMKRRNKEFNREISDAFKEIGRRDTPILDKIGVPWSVKDKSRRYTDNIRAAAFWHIGFMDRYGVALPIWLGAHEKGIKEGMSDKEASRYADKIVRESQGSGVAKDLAAVQASNNMFMRWLTLFYTWFSAQINLQWQAGRHARRGQYMQSAQIVFWVMIIMPMVDAMLLGEGIPDEDDEDDWLQWSARNIIGNAFAGVPVLRDAANTLERKAAGQYANFNPGPITRIYETTERSSNDLWNATFGDDDKVSRRWVRNAIETPGYFLGLPTGQPAATTQFLYDFYNGDAEPDSAADWYSGLLKGRVEDD